MNKFTKTYATLMNEVSGKSDLDTCLEKLSKTLEKATEQYAKMDDVKDVAVKKHFGMAIELIRSYYDIIKATRDALGIDMHKLDSYQLTKICNVISSLKALESIIPILNDSKETVAKNLVKDYCNLCEEVCKCWCISELRFANGQWHHSG